MRGADLVAAEHVLRDDELLAQFADLLPRLQKLRRNRLLKLLLHLGGLKPRFVDGVLFSPFARSATERPITPSSRVRSRSMTRRRDRGIRFFWCRLRRPSSSWRMNPTCASTEAFSTARPEISVLSWVTLGVDEAELALECLAPLRHLAGLVRDHAGEGGFAAARGQLGGQAQGVGLVLLGLKPRFKHQGRVELVPEQVRARLDWRGSIRRSTSPDRTSCPSFTRIAWTMPPSKCWTTLRLHFGDDDAGADDGAVQADEGRPEAHEAEERGDEGVARDGVAPPIGHRAARARQLSDHEGEGRCVLMAQPALRWGSATRRSWEAPWGWP